MDKLPVPQTTNCWICYNNDNNTNLTIANSDNFLANCKAYLDPSIITVSFENKSSISCCHYCYESTVELILLEKQIEKLRKEITELNSQFLRNVLERRNHFNKDKKDVFNISASPTDKCVTVRKSSIYDSTVALKNLSVQKEMIKSGSKIYLSDSQGGTGDLVNDLGIDTVDHEKNIHSDDDTIEVKYSYDERVSKVLDTVNKQIASNQSMPIIKTQEHLQTIKTSMSDLLKCLKMPVVHLERLKFGSSRKPKTVVEITSSNSNLKITDPGNGSSFNTDNNYLPTENIFQPEPIVCPKDLENCVIVHTRPLNASVLAEDYAINWVNFEKNTEENKPYKCSICGQDFFELCDLEDHEKLHNIVHPTNYSCSICQKYFLDPDKLKLHEKLHIVKRPLTSSLSSKSVTKSLSNLHTHESFHSEDKPFKCSHCSKSFKNGSSLKRHQKFHFEDKPYHCSFCSKSFFLPSDAKNHEMTHTGERPFKCSYCTKAYIHSRDLKVHERIHTGDTPCKCSVCSKSFRSYALLKKHQKLHPESRTYKCSFCPKSFVFSNTAIIHEMTHTGDRPFKCSSCPKSYLNSLDLQIHERTHTGERPYACSVCLKSFQSERALKLHNKTIHSAERPYKCSFCPKSFILPNVLKNHETLHTGERPFKCSFCTKSFRSALDLKLHEAVHIGEGSSKSSLLSKSFISEPDLKQQKTVHTAEKPKPYKCSFCPKSFCSEVVFKQHEKLHIGERLYKCSFCTQSFTSELGLTRHETVHAEERQHKCSSCEMSFIQEQHLNFHLKHIHGYQTEEFILP